MIHSIKPYHLPLRINKCLKCLRHDHTTKSCSRPRLCPRCAEEHSLENGCPNPERCVNCGGDHISIHSGCPVVQEKRCALAEQAKQQRAELLVLAERQQHQHHYQENDFPAVTNNNPLHSSSRVSTQPMNTSQRSYAHVIQKQNDQGSQKNIDYILSTFLNKMEHRLDEFSSRLSSQLCDIEKKINVSTDRQFELENVIHDIILPSTQESSNILSQLSKN